MKTLLPAKLALLLLSCLLLACELEDPQEGLRVEDIIVLEATDSVLLADGRDLTVLQAQLGPQAAPNLSVAFTTNGGQFESSAGGTNQVSVRASGNTAMATLQVGTQPQERVRVSAEVSTNDESGNPLLFQADRVLEFRRAFPEFLRLTLSERSLLALPGEEADLRVELLRSMGQVSDGTEVFFAAEAPADGPVVSLPERAIADTGFLTVSVSVQDTLAGAVRLRAWVLDANLDTTATAAVDLDVVP